jgi:hypothetical protein
MSDGFDNSKLQGGSITRPVRGTFASRRSVTIRETLTKNTGVFSKLPVGAMEIRSEKEKQMMRKKTFIYLAFDLLLLVGLIVTLSYSIVICKKKVGSCEDKMIFPACCFLFVCVAISFVIDWKTWL